MTDPIPIVDVASRPPLAVRHAYRPRERAGSLGFAPMPGPHARPLRIALINPKFDPSFFGYDFYLPLLPGRIRAEGTGGALPLLAALVPQPHTIELLDENVAPIDFDRLRSFDIVGITGMIVQRRRIRQILSALADHPGLVVAGGPYVSVDQAFFDGLCDVVFVGEADVTWPHFLEAVARGEPHRTVYEQSERTDMTRLPVPRFDLLQVRHYRSATIQFSRGCPFLCEFCDIITLFGRIPRTKTPAQLIEELEALRRVGFRVVNLVDDNFIGNKKLARELLVVLARWQADNGYPLELVTEASINLADEPELLALMHEANFTSVFIGIESPSMESLAEVRKVQNIRGDSLQDKIARVRDAGLNVTAGFMVGFDSDDTSIFERQFAFVRETRIARAVVGILTAIPSTPLYERLRREGRLRLDEADCNFEPRRMSATELREGYLRLVRRLYEPDSYFERLFGSWGSSASFRERWARRAQRRKPPAWPQRLAARATALIVGWRLARSMANDGELGSVGGAYLRIYRTYRRHGMQGIRWAQFVQYAAQHWHCYLLYKRAGSDRDGFNTYSYGILRDETGVAHGSAGAGDREADGLSGMAEGLSSVEPVAAARGAVAAGSRPADPVADRAPLR